MVAIYNSFTRLKEPLKPIEPKKIRMYVCGMTVYDFCHIGHARVMVVFDMVARYLRSIGFDLLYVRNITDIFFTGTVLSPNSHLQQQLQ